MKTNQNSTQAWAILNKETSRILPFGTHYKRRDTTLYIREEWLGEMNKVDWSKYKPIKVKIIPVE